MQIIFRNTRTGEEQIMPVTPPGFQVEQGRLVEQVDMASFGQVNLPGLETLFNEQLTFLLPSSGRNYTSLGYAGEPYSIVERLVRWSKAGDVLRLIVTQTPVNVPVLIAPVRYGEQDGSGDVYATLTLRQFRELTAETVSDSGTGNAARAAPAQERKETTYTVVSGDTLWGICRKFYGNGSLATKLAGYNGVKNANLIYVGQRLNIPDKGLL